MSQSESAILRLCDDPEFFRTAVQFTAQATEFSPRLIEKDYICTVLLEQLFSAPSGLVFKGGTCLAKVHADFYRLSEDLDFVISIPENAPRTRRSKLALALKEAVDSIETRLPMFRLVAPLTGANNSTQYNAVIGYTPLSSPDADTIKIEVGLREPLLLPVLNGPAQTILLNPGSSKPLFPPLVVRCIAKTEAFAEKFRAALSRLTVAPRDFFDLDYAVRKLDLDVDSMELIDLVRVKLKVKGTGPVDVSRGRFADLQRQVGPQLEPVLRSIDFAEFDADRAFRIVENMARKVS